MEIVNRVARMGTVGSKLLASELKVGLISTMGGIHPGHVALIRAARAMSDVVVVSIYVDRRRLRSDSDYERYPRDLAKDVDILRRENVDYIFAPAEEEMYPPDFATYVQVEDAAGEFAELPREAILRGLTTGTLKMIHIVRPAFFFLSEKDALEGAVLLRMFRDLNIGTEVVLGPAARYPDGLAYGVRNQFLSPEERAAAPILYRSLQAGAALVAAGETQAKKVIAEVARGIETEPLAKLQYAVVIKTEALELLSRVEGKAWLAAGARIGATLLEDSLPVEMLTKS